MKTVRDLREALRGLPGAMPLLIDECEDWDLYVSDCHFVNGEPAHVAVVELHENESEANPNPRG